MAPLFIKAELFYLTLWKSLDSLISARRLVGIAIDFNTYMRFTRPVILLFSIFILSTAGFAQTITGCRIGNDNFLYANYIGVQSYPVSQWYQPTFPTYSSPTKPFLQDWYNDYASCPKFVGNPTYGGQCAVQGITVASGGWVQNLGLKITYTLSYQCPIDNEVFVLLTGVAILSIYFIRRQIG